LTTLTDQLRELNTVGLIRASAEQEAESIFRHALVQEATYNSLLKADRRKMHNAVGRAQELIYANQLDEMASELARHFEEASDDVRAQV
jgi:predicted ATPase